MAINSFGRSHPEAESPGLLTRRQALQALGGSLLAGMSLTAPHAEAQPWPPMGDPSAEDKIEIAHQNTLRQPMNKALVYLGDPYYEGTRAPVRPIRSFRKGHYDELRSSWRQEEDDEGRWDSPRVHLGTTDFGGPIPPTLQMYAARQLQQRPAIDRSILLIGRFEQPLLGMVESWRSDHSNPSVEQMLEFFNFLSAESNHITFDMGLYEDRSTPNGTETDFDDAQYFDKLVRIGDKIEEQIRYQQKVQEYLGDIFI